MAAGSSQQLVRRLVQPRKLRPLSRWPGHWPASEKMQVNMEDGLAGVGPGVDDRAVAGLVDLLSLGDALGHKRELAERDLILRGHIVDGADVLLRNDENVYGRLGIDVFKGEARVILKHDARRNLLPDELAEQTIGHRVRSLELIRQ